MIFKIRKRFFRTNNKRTDEIEEASVNSQSTESASYINDVENVEDESHYRKNIGKKGRAYSNHKASKKSKKNRCFGFCNIKDNITES